MGLFSKLRKQVSTGGVKVQLTVPAGVALDAEAVEAEVSITSSDEAQEIRNVYVELKLERTTRGRGRGGNGARAGHDHDETRTTTLARADLGAISIDARDTRRYDVALPLEAVRANAQRTSGIDLGDNTFAQAAGSLLSSAMQGPTTDRYLLRAVVELDGMRDPTDTKVLNIAGASSSRTTFGFTLSD